MRAYIGRLIKKDLLGFFINKMKYTIKEILDYLERNNILLINKEEIGSVILPEVDENYILDDDKDKNIEE